jgi:hypothetical protein
VKCESESVIKTGPMTVVEVVMERYSRVIKTGPMTVVEVVVERVVPTKLVEQESGVIEPIKLEVPTKLVEQESGVIKTGPMTVVEVVVERYSRVMEEDLAWIVHSSVADLLGVIRSRKVAADGGSREVQQGDGGGSGADSAFQRGRSPRRNTQSQGGGRQSASGFSRDSSRNSGGCQS